jgi:hypothetical protein
VQSYTSAVVTLVINSVKAVIANIMNFASRKLHGVASNPAQSLWIDRGFEIKPFKSNGVKLGKGVSRRFLKDSVS